MAEDWLMLEHFQEKFSSEIRFRHYQWESPAITFGYAQSYDWVVSQGLGSELDFCRRPTGGGLVDHRQDWTYSVIIPLDHPKSILSPSALYQGVHQSIGECLMAQGIKFLLSPCICSEKKKPVTVCFVEPSPMDVVLEGTGQKVAGAALKRTKRGTLLQGSINKGLLSGVCWDQFGQDLKVTLAGFFDEACQDCEWPAWGDTLAREVQDKFASTSWQHRR